MTSRRRHRRFTTVVCIAVKHDLLNALSTLTVACKHHRYTLSHCGLCYAVTSQFAAMPRSRHAYAIADRPNSTTSDDALNSNCNEARGRGQTDGELLH
ncbi:hypothetical protein GW17_00035586 [Ensete ventricosum]|nr:hypothetical protein GW17_00035586 [Ensete ventricosum]